jgi:hypothetical protein
MTLRTAIIASTKPSEAANSKDGESDSDDDKPLTAIAKKATAKLENVAAPIKVRRRLLRDAIVPSGRTRACASGARGGGVGQR